MPASSGTALGCTAESGDVVAPTAPVCDQVICRIDDRDRFDVDRNPGNKGHRHFFKTLYGEINRARRFWVTNDFRARSTHKRRCLAIKVHCRRAGLARFVLKREMSQSSCITFAETQPDQWDGCNISK